MASVSAVSSTDFRANLSQPQNAAPEGDDPFSLLLNSVADVKANAQRPEAPHVPDRRKDAPAKQPKPETDADRQAKRHAKDTARPDAKAPVETSGPVKPAADEEAETDDVENEDTTAADTLLAIALGETEEPAVPQAAGEAEVPATPVVAPVIAADADADAEAPVAAPALAAAVADAMQADPDGAEPAQTVQAAAAKPKVAVTVTSQAKPTVELPLHAFSDDGALNLPKPFTLAVASDAQAQMQSTSAAATVNAAPAAPGPAQLEMLNAAISKHVQLALGRDANDAVPEMQKPLISSNAVTPNFAMTAQINAPVQVQTQQATDAGRAVPLNDLAVEIATRAGKGERRFDIRLDPPELGRIDVRLEIDSKGNTTTKLIVERAETLDMLQRDARGLEKALQNAGLKTDAGGLQFSLSQDAQAQHGQHSHGAEPRGQHDAVQADGEAMAEVSINSASLAAQLRGGVDIRI